MIINYILQISFIVFLLRIIIFSIGAIVERRKGLGMPSLKQNPFISVVVPGRNEQDNIGACITSIAESNYSKDKFEIIAVNDRSHDNTKKVLENLQSKYSNLRIINISDDTALKNLQGKPGALQAGIDQAKGEIILMTDADCTVNPDWIATLSNLFNNPDLGLAAGYSAIKTNKIFDKIQAVEWTYMHTIATAGIGLNMPLSCYGNNIAVRKKDFDAIGGYRSVGFSVTEDLALLQAMHKSGKKLRYLTHEKSTITTLPCPTIKDYLKQHHRWAIGALDLGLKAFLFVLSSLAMWIGIGISLATWQPDWLAAFILQRLIGDSLLTIPTAIILKQKKVIPWIIPSIFFFMIMELVAPFFLLKRDVKWKDQVFESNTHM